jgi:hypothetical protein
MLPFGDRIGERLYMQNATANGGLRLLQTIGPASQPYAHQSSLMRSSCAGSHQISRLVLYLSGFIATNSTAGIRSDMMGPIESGSLWSFLSTACRKALPALAASHSSSSPLWALPESQLSERCWASDATITSRKQPTHTATLVT